MGAIFIYADLCELKTVEKTYMIGLGGRHVPKKILANSCLVILALHD